MSIYDTLNDRQREAVYCTEGPLLVLAGAGSGKTRALTHRVAYLIDEKKINPYNVMAITFTNKAAAEMRERVDSLVGHGCEQVWVATFHSSCVRILRRFISHIGFDTSFTIYDGDDQKTLLKRIFKEMAIDTKQFKEKNAMSIISNCKDELMTAEQYTKEASDYYEQTMARIYTEYQKQLRKNNALDFDDLIVRTVELFEHDREVLELYQDRFRYIMVDEYQDTNNAQFRLIELLAGKSKNLCVVGDDDQSIYRFRGANIENILNFEHSFPGAKVIKLEQNYRSTPNILDTANEVIKQNRGRKSKTLWTANEAGDKVKLYQYDTAADEADAVVRDIQKKAADRDYNRYAILYRTNAQSRLMEERCVALGVPYQLIGGVNFYQRKEIKDILAYLKVIAGGRDDLALLRIINVPKRGIGATSVDKLSLWAASTGKSLCAACEEASQIPRLGKSGSKIEKFIEMIDSYRDGLRLGSYTIGTMIESILDDTGYKKELEDEGEIEAQSRLENIEELISKAVSFEQEHESADEDVQDEESSAGSMLDRFLEEVALVADIDRFDESESKITLMTLHGAKGLEFEDVYMVGMEDGLFPGFMSINSDDRSELEEERRLCYVGITRAKMHLTMTYARSRMVNGEMRWSKVSRFVENIPDELLDRHVLDSPSFTLRKEDPIRDGLPWDDGAMQRFKKKPKTVSAEGVGAKKQSGGLSFGKQFAIVKPDHLDYEVGDRVSHVKFGEGRVLDIQDIGKDYEVRIEFDSAGIKKMLAGFAKLQKI